MSGPLSLHVPPLPPPEGAGWHVVQSTEPGADA